MPKSVSWLLDYYPWVVKILKPNKIDTAIAFKSMIYKLT